MEVFIFDWWWTSHQSSAHKSLRILRFCAVPWKDEWEPTIKHCMRNKIGVVQKFTTIQELWTQLTESRWNSSGTSSKDSPNCSSATKFKSLLSRLSVTPEKFTGRIIFMSMFNDISWGSKDNKKCESNAQHVSLFEKRFGAGQWSFLEPGSEKKWCSISEDSPQGEWDRIAEQMMFTFAESKHPVFRSTSPLSRGVLKSKGGGKLSIHYCADPGTIETCFSYKYFWKISSVFTEQSQKCVKNVNPAMIEQEDLLWKDNPTHCSCQMWWRQTYLWLMILHMKKIYCEEKENELKSYHNKTEWANFVLMQDSWPQLKSDSVHDERHWRILTIHSISGLSWVDFAKRRKFIWTKRLDSREHQDWTSVGSYNLFPTR